MSEKDKKAARLSGDDADGGPWPGIDSRFRLVVVAAQRSKQLLRGARPKIDQDPLRRRNTSIALREVRQGLVSFENGNDEPEENGSGGGETG